MKKAFTILAASEIDNPQRFGVVSEYQDWVEGVAAVCRKHFDALYFIPDRGTYVDFSQAFKKLGGTIYAVLPDSRDRRLLNNSERLGAIPYELKDGSGWNYLNTHFIGLAEYSVCLSYSPGSLLEMCSAKYLKRYDSKKISIFIDKRGVSQELPEELADDLSPIYYFTSDEELNNLLTERVK